MEQLEIIVLIQLPRVLGIPMNEYFCHIKKSEKSEFPLENGQRPKTVLRFLRMGIFPD